MNESNRIGLVLELFASKRALNREQPDGLSVKSMKVDNDSSVDIVFDKARFKWKRNQAKNPLKVSDFESVLAKVEDGNAPDYTSSSKVEQALGLPVTLGYSVEGGAISTWLLEQAIEHGVLDADIESVRAKLEKIRTALS